MNTMYTGRFTLTEDVDLIIQYYPPEYCHDENCTMPPWFDLTLHHAAKFTPEENVVMPAYETYAMPKDVLEYTNLEQLNEMLQAVTESATSNTEY